MPLMQDLIVYSHQFQGHHLAFIFLPNSRQLFRDVFWFTGMGMDNQIIQEW